ncbi:MAG: substrate-binding domain-containing protein [Bacteroidetes bacterium]|nr:substrate-binding domain-containing protein [Bacteroidota bacterium]
MANKNENQLSGIKEIARRAKVSIGTVDRVIHNRTGVSPKTREKVNQIIKEINYQPNLLGRILASKKKSVYVSLIPKVSAETSYWEAPLKGIETAASELKQYNIEIKKYFYDQNDKASFIAQFQKILRDKPDGILLAPTFIEESVNFTNRCRILNIPYVFIDSDIPDQPSLSYIGQNVFYTGYLAANLSNYLVKKNDKVLIVHISTDLQNHHHLLRKEDGFRSYFRNQALPNTIEKIDILKTNYNSIKKALDHAFEEHPDIRLVFVTNSKVTSVARYIKESKKEVKLIGCDFLKENKGYLDDGIIDFLICQKPWEQAYKGIMALYKHLVLKLPVEDYTYMPIDIIMRSNYSFYHN